MEGVDIQNLEGTQLLKLASQVVQQGKNELAIPLFDEIIRRSKGQPYPYLSRATCNHELKRYEAVVEDCKKLLSFPDQKVEETIVKGSTTLHSVAHALLNNCYKALDQLELASDSLKKRAEIENNNKKADKETNKVSNKLDKDSQRKVDKLMSIAKKNFKLMNYEQSKENYLEILSYSEDDKVLNSNLSLINWLLKDYNNALFHANECVRVDPDWYKGYYRQGQALLGLEMYEDAIKVLEDGYKLNPEDDLLLTSLARARTPNSITKFVLEDVGQPLMFLCVAVFTAVWLDVIDLNEIKKVFYKE